MPQPGGHPEQVVSGKIQPAHFSEAAEELVRLHDQRRIDHHQRGHEMEVEGLCQFRQAADLKAAQVKNPPTQFGMHRVEGQLPAPSLA
ncbi:hypothetical protein D3C81_1751900 [compost metagenome]